jgi:predicted RNase H-like HicB family nuclease
MTPDTYSVIIVWSDEDKAFIANVSELPGCMAHGETRAEAIKEIEFAIENWIDTARETGREIPAPNHFADYQKLRERTIAERIQQLQAEVARQVNAIFRTQWSVVNIPATQPKQESGSRNPQAVSK